VDIIGAKGDAGGGENWSYKMCKTPVKSSPPTSQHPTFYRQDAHPVALKGYQTYKIYLLYNMILEINNNVFCRRLHCRCPLLLLVLEMQSLTVRNEYAFHMNMHAHTHTHKPFIGCYSR